MNPFYIDPSILFLTFNFLWLKYFWIIFFYLENKKEDGNPVEDTLEGKEGRKEIETGRLEKLFMDSLSQGMKDVIKKDSNDQKGFYKYKIIIETNGYVKT